MQKVHLKRTKRVLSGHLWIFSNELRENPKNYLPGSLVEVYDSQEIFLGTGYINPNSLISIRLLTRERSEIDSGFLRKRIVDALSLRKRLFGDRDCLRLIYSEGDYLPGLIADRYGKCLVLQFLTCGMENLRDKVIDLFEEIVAPDTIVLRNDSRSRLLEGLPLLRETVRGDLAVPTVIDEDGLRLQVDPYEGQKTGFFLDQKRNRLELRKMVSGGKGLDLFSYSGAWALNLAVAGVEVTGVDDSGRAVSLASLNAEMNGLAAKARFVKDDVFSFLDRELRAGEKRYDVIVLDPPAFVKSAGKLKEAVRAYRQLNTECMRLLRPGGMLVSSSCSYHLDRETFLEMLRSASKSAARGIRMVALRSQDMDHPVLLSMPETEYLKCAYLLVD